MMDTICRVLDGNRGKFALLDMILTFRPIYTKKLLLGIICPERSQQMYKFIQKRLPNFFRYVNKVYEFSKIVNSMKDKRSNTKITSQTIFLSVFLCCLLRFGSLNRLQFEAKNKRISKFLKLDKEDNG